MVESEFTRTAIVFLVARSLTTISPASAFMELMVAAICRNEPDTIRPAAIEAPSPALSPSTRTWSPTLISARELGWASLNFTESGA